MSCRHLSIAGLLVLVGLACVGPAKTTPGLPEQADQYLIAPPDVLSISVRPEPEITRELVVRPDGRITFDLIGDVEVEGRTVIQVRDEIAQRISEYIVSPDVTVALAKSNSRRFHIFGEVARPGSYALVGRWSALDALGAAGGPTRFASLSRALLIRPGRGQGHVYAVNFNAITLRGRGDTDHVLQPGDVIYVPPNTSARLGYALQIFFYPLQQIIGLGGNVARTVYVGG